MYLSGLSPSQEAFVREMGYPQTFSKIFSINNGEVRVDEIWYYTSKGICENFINGIFIEEKKIDIHSTKTPETIFKPEDYRFDTTLQDVLNMHGTPVYTKKGKIGETELKLYVYNGIIFGFLNGKLASVMTNLRVD